MGENFYPSQKANPIRDNTILNFVSHRAPSKTKQKRPRSRLLSNHLLTKGSSNETDCIKSTFEEKDGQLARVVKIKTLVGLAGHFKTETFAHNAMERVSILSIHLFFHEFASHLHIKISVSY